MSDARARRAALAIQESDLSGVVTSTYGISGLSPAGQYEALVGMIEAIDQAYPAPYTMTPPYGEPIPQEEITPETVIDRSNAGPVPDLQGYTDDELLPVISDAHSAEFPAPEWENDPQYFGLGVPPGVPAWSQPVESGHSQIIVLNPAAENGWDEWSGKPKIARLARHENDFKDYQKGASTGHMLNTAALGQIKEPKWMFTAQQRDLMLSELNKRGIHGVVVQDVPSYTYTEQVTQVDPSDYANQEYPFTDAGVV